jgi:ketosteroid isomerase-like protein
MKQLLLLPILLFSLASFAQKTDEQQIRSILDAQTKHWNNGDLEQFMKGYWNNDSLMFIGKSGITYGYSNTLENYKKGYPSKDAMGTLSFPFIQLKRISADAYFVIGQWQLARPKEGDIGGHYTLLFRKINGEWVIVADHSS